MVAPTRLNVTLHLHCLSCHLYVNILIKVKLILTLDTTPPFWGVTPNQ